jgi:heat shock protein HtpX
MATRFRADHGLNRRMVLVMFLLGAVYVVFMGAITALVGVSYLPVVIVIALGFAALQWYFSDKVALWSLSARVVTPEQAPELHGMIDRLCALADMPKPRVAYSHFAVPNAFATGRSQKNAVICVTRGIVDKLTPEELEGVLSHELSHIAHKDVAVMTIASFLGVLAGVVARYGKYARMGDSRDQNAAMIMLGIWVISLAVYALSFLLIRALSRYRELAADRAGAYLTGRPSSLASALVKLSDDMNAIPDRDLRKVSGMNAFAFTPAVKSSKASGFGRIFSTHPSTEKRLEQLSKISAELGRRQ